MPTIIRRFFGASFPGTIILDPEPEIYLPSSGLLGAYRFKRDLAFSAPSRGGSWPNLVQAGSGTDVEFSGKSALFKGKALAVPNTPMPSGDMTMIVVSRQNVPAGSPSELQWLGGALDGGAGPYGLARSTNTGNVAMQLNGATVVQMAPDGGDRYEFLAATMDWSGMTAAIHRPRTETVKSNTFTSAAIPTNAVRVLGGHNGRAAYLESVFCAYFNRVLTDMEISDVYESAKDALSVSGISI